jgi:hypothetical protein
MDSFECFNDHGNRCLMGDGSVADAQDTRAIDVNNAILDFTGIFSLLEFCLLLAVASLLIAMDLSYQSMNAPIVFVVRVMVETAQL